MSERWIKLTHELATKPEVFSLSRKLEQPPPMIIGCLYLVWCWFDLQSVDGLIYDVTLEDADRIAQLGGFATCAEAVGWLECCEEGLRMPNFEEHTSQSAKKRASDARRKRVARTNGQTSAAPRTNGGQKTDQRRGEERRTTTGPEDAGPEDLETTETQGQTWTNKTLNALKLKTTGTLEPLKGPQSQRRCWTKSAGWNDRFIAELASRDAAAHAAAVKSVFEWFRRQLAAPDPIVAEPTNAAAAAVVAVAMEAAKRPGLEKRVGWFRATLSENKTDRLENDSPHLRTAASFVKSQTQKGTQ